MDERRRRAARFAGALLVTTGTITATFSLPGQARAEQLSWPAGLGTCHGASCPQHSSTTYDPAQFNDTGVAVYVGGNWLADNVAESEGLGVVAGDLTVRSKNYELGIVAGGSSLRPPPGSDSLIVGGDITVERPYTLRVGPAHGLAVRHAGTVTGHVETAALRHDRDALAPYTSVSAELSAISMALAGLPATEEIHHGTVTPAGGGTIYLVGDGVKPFQVFNLTTDLEKAIDSDATVAFDRIPPDATVIVNFAPGPAELRTNNVLVGRTPDGLRERLIWNFPHSSTVRITGTSQLPGMILTAQPDSVTRIEVPGSNGRVYVVGDLHHSSRGGTSGQELHSYPFRGKLPNLGDTEATPVVPAPVPNPAPDSDSVPNPAPKPDPAPSPDPVPNPAPDPEIDTDAVPEPEIDTDAVPEPVPNPAPDPEIDTDAVPDPGPEPAPGPQPPPAPDPNPAPDPEADSSSDPEVQFVDDIVLPVGGPDNAAAEPELASAGASMPLPLAVAALALILIGIGTMGLARQRR